MESFWRPNIQEMTQMETSSDGDDDESIIIDLTKSNPSIQEILFVVTIDSAD
jgi:stress response protein SCP2